MKQKKTFRNDENKNVQKQNKNSQTEIKIAKTNIKQLRGTGPPQN